MMSPKRRKKVRPQTRRSSKPPLRRAVSPEDLLVDRVNANARRLADYARRAGGRPENVVGLVDTDIDEAIARLVRLLEPWDALDALTWLRLANLPALDGYRESTHDGLLAVAELAGLALLARDPLDRADLQDSLNPIAGAALGDPTKVDALCREVSAVVHQLLGAVMVEQIAAASAQDSGAFVRFRIREREMLLRNIEYPHILTDHLRAQLGQESVRKITTDALGFDADDALAVVDAFEHRFTAIWAVRSAGAEAEAAAFRAGSHPHFLATRERLGSRVEVAVALFSAAYVQDRLGQRLALTEADLTDLADIPQERVAAVLAAFSQPFLGAAHDPATSIRAFLRGENQWRLRPILDAGDGRYLCVDTGLMLSVVREVIELGLLPADRPEYAKATAQWMEDSAVTCLTEVLRPDEVHRNVEYISADGTAVELDVLLVCDTVALAVEAKGTTLSARSRTGDRARMSRDLGRIVTKTFEQADRVRTTIEAHGELRVRGRDARTISLPHVRRVFPVALTLEDVSSIAGTVHELLTSGLVTFDQTPPWLISQHDLRVITEIIEGPAQFLAYLDQHERAVTTGVLSVPEELDLFMMFLKGGLWLGDFLDEAGRPTERLLLQSQTDDLDAYYLHTTEASARPAAKPKQHWNPAIMRKLLTELETARPTGWATAAIALQRGDAHVRRLLAGAPKRLARRVRMDGLEHSETQFFEDPHHDQFGVTVLVVPTSWDQGRLSQVLSDLALASKHVRRAASWTGLAVRADTPETIRALVQLDEAWEPDTELDALVERLKLRPEAPVEVVPTSG
ncbi:hypothetical protein [Cellulomonas fengjieae]|uniref:hypothetical protein n=1 Tax=Cellulomonas fengjieae TaxID=2819978 RepID=UPI001AAF7A52|nr:hypothetical protein [Cellulomonas fengjieae]MBO3102570.1 hypothetical protein [Cellulomonas fengjieae]